MEPIILAITDMERCQDCYTLTDKDKLTSCSECGRLLCPECNRLLHHCTDEDWRDPQKELEFGEYG